MSGSGSGNSSTRRNSILLDVRSDIYSLGATLYHLLTGTRPVPDATQVKPILSPNVSPAVAAIIMKAMAPDPTQRYQTAQEMLDAFRHLHENDPRAKKLTRRTTVVMGLFAAVLLIGAVCTFTGLRWMERDQARAAEAALLAEEAERTAKQALTLVTQSEEAYRSGDIVSAIKSAKEAMALDTPYVSQAQKALTDALGVYDLSDGYKPHLMLGLPSEPLKVELSPAGAHVAVMVSGALLVFDTDTGEKIAELPAEPSAWADMAFVDRTSVG